MTTRPTNVTTGPITGSRKVYVAPEGHPDLRVPFREIPLSGGEPSVRVYDPSGPYTEGRAIDLSEGLPRVRERWLEARGHLESYQGREVRPEDDGAPGPEDARQQFPKVPRPRRGKPGQLVTQLEFARAGIITEEMVYAAARENLGRSPFAGDGESFGASIPDIVTPEFVRDEVARGRAIIPRTTSTTPSSSRWSIGRNFLVKINANIGNSAVACTSPPRSTRWCGRSAGARTR